MGVHAVARDEIRVTAVGGDRPAYRIFLSEDPIGLAGGINLYAFAAADPISGSDPSGLLQVCDSPTIVPSGPLPPGWPRVTSYACWEESPSEAALAGMIFSEMMSAASAPGYTALVAGPSGSWGPSQNAATDPGVERRACVAGIGAAVFALAQDAFVVGGAIRVAHSGSRMVVRAFDVRSFVSNSIPAGGQVRNAAQGWGLVAAGYGAGGLANGFGVEPLFDGGVLGALEAAGGFIPGVNFGLATVRAVRACR